MADASSPRAALLPALAVAGTVAALFAATVLPFDGFLSDDALISLRYAQRLLAGQGLTWDDAGRVEGYSNLLWVLWCAALGGLGVDLVDAARASGALALFAALLLAAGFPRRTSPVTQVVVGATLAVTGSLAAWARAGLETPLLALEVAALVRALPLAAQGVAWARVVTAGAMAALCLTRPDGVVLAGAAWAAVLWRSGPRRMSLARLALAPAGAVLGQLAFRLGYYGDWVPNTARAKVALSVERLETGLAYVAGGGLLVHAVLALGAVAAAVSWRRADEAARLRLSAGLAPLAAWALYLVGVGGDVFTGWRQWVPAAVLMGGLGAEVLEPAIAAGTTRARRMGVVLLGLVLLVVPSAWLGRRDDSLRTTRRNALGHEGLEVGRGLALAFGAARPLVAVEAAGGVPYASGFPAIDMLGLCDAHIARHRPADFGSGQIGHELGDGQYVWERQPDLVIFSGAGGVEVPYYRSARELAALPGWARAYAFVVVGIPGPRHLAGRFYVRRDSPTLGLRRFEGGVEVPALHLARSVAAPAVYREGRGLVLRLPPGKVGGALVTDLPPGRWRLTAPVSGSAPGVEVSWRVTGDRVRELEPGVFEVGGPGPADVELAVTSPARAGVMELGAVTLRLER